MSEASSASLLLRPRALRLTLVRQGWVGVDGAPSQRQSHAAHRDPGEFSGRPDGEPLLVEQVANALEQQDVFRPVVSPTAAALQAA